MKTNQQGFTLIELMIALVLGLIIVAAAVGVYIANHRTLASQRSSSEMQSASLFGIQPLESRLRMANLGIDANSIDGTTIGGGIVLSTTNASVNANLLSRSASGASNTATASDQLTIQFVNVTPTPIYNCEGTEVPVGIKTIERYFVRTSGANAQPHELVLACDAGVFNAAGQLSSFGDNGVEMISGMDHFRVLLGTQIIQNNQVMTRFYTIAQYNAENPQPPIISVKTGVIARGTTPITISEGLGEFSLFGTTERLKDSVPKGFVRNTYETTTLLRNARAIAFDTPPETRVK